MEALAGIKIIEFSQAFAGPYATALLGFLGAEVIKVESMNWPDLSRYIEFNSSKPRVPEPEKSGAFNTLNLNKKSIRLNITQPQGTEIAKALIAKCDVLMENMRPGIMEKRGLGYETLKSVKPDLIYLSSCAGGQTGPWSTFAGYAANFAALSGLSALTGYEDGMPSEYMASADLKSAYTAAAAILTALMFRENTQNGQYIDLSSMEAISASCGDQFLSYAMTGVAPRRNGNRDRQAAPHECYPCAGEDRWISIAIFTEQEWQTLCHTLEMPELASDPRFNSLEGRLSSLDELDAVISQRTKSHDVHELARKLQAFGVAAAVSMSSEDLFNDPHLKSRQAFVESDHPAIGKEWIIGPPWKLSKTPPQIKRHGPYFGEHNEVVFGELLGMSQDEIKRLEEEQVIF